MTKNHNYGKPEPGMSDWHVPINENFDKLDRDVEIRDVEANLGDYAAKEGAKYFATDTERVFVSDGDSWAPTRSSGLNPEFSSARVKELNETIFAGEFDGEGLASKIENSLKWLQNTTNGQGRIRVTQKSDGTRWIWDKELVIDPTIYRGIEIDIDTNVEIEYPGNGIALTFDSNWSDQNNNFDINSTITGGRWYSTGNDPQGLLRLEDCYKTHVRLTNVADFKNDSRDAFGVQLRNIDGWTESTKILDTRFDQCSIAIDTQPSAYNSGNGTSSFHGTEIRGNKIAVSNVGIRARGGFDYSAIEYNSFFSKSGQDDAKHIQLGGTAGGNPFMDGTIIQGNKHEDPGGQAADDFNDAAYYLAPSFHDFKQPTLINNKIYLSSNGSAVLNEAGANSLLHIRSNEGAVQIEDLINDNAAKFKSTSDGTVALETGLINKDYHSDIDLRMKEIAWTHHVPQDLRDLNPPEGQGTMSYHDGSGSDNTEGPAFFDGNQWKSAVSGQVIE